MNDRLVSVRKYGEKYTVDIRYLATDPFACFLAEPEQVNPLLVSLGGKLVFDERTIEMEEKSE